MGGIDEVAEEGEKSERDQTHEIDGTVAVTGATGFIGRSLCRELLDEGHDVVGLTRSKSPPQLGVEWRRADVTNRGDVMDALADADYIFHLAGIGLMDGTPEEVREVNVEGTKNVVEASRNGDCRRLVVTSTAGTRHRPGRAAATEADVANPVGAYQQSKLAAERVVQTYVADGGDAVVAHPTSVFGPGDPRTTPKLVGLVDSSVPVYLPGGGSVVSVSDVASGLVAAAERGGRGEHYLLGGENLTFGEMLESIADAMDASPPPVRVPPFAVRAAGYVVGPLNRTLGTNFFPVNADMAELSTRYRFYDSGKARDAMGYAITPFEDHVTDAIEWYRNGR